VRDARAHLERSNVDVLGISPDAPNQQKTFQRKHDLGFSLLCDTDHAVAEQYGTWGEKKMYGKAFMGIVRSAFLIDGSGRIVQTWYKISPKNTVPELMKAIETLEG
jgi:peroxiredoxin Q/BCP